MAGERALRQLIESVADGMPLDWEALSAAAANDRARQRLQSLRLVAEVAAVHQSQTADPAEEPPLLESQIIDSPGRWGHLLLIERIGEGSFGEVYRAHDPWLDREVALKLLRPRVVNDAPGAGILREAQALARVRHPNVVQVHGAAVHQERLGLWMELLRGETLEKMLASRGKFSPDEAALAGAEICRALSAVHAAGLVHCDIKATNVMREDGGRLVLMDFGAGQRSDLAATGPLEAVGTPLYVAPEVLIGQSATPRSDIYSLGVLLYRLLTGEYPVSAASVDELREVHRRRGPLRLTDARPDVPEALADVVERALSTHPDRRFATAAEMQSALSHIVHTGNRAVPPVRRLPWRPAALVLAVALLAAATAFMFWRGRSDAPPVVAGQISTLAVLPFQNLSMDPGDAYLASAVPMELSARLGQIGALRVVPWTFMRRYQGTGPHSFEDVASRTGAEAIVEGVVQRVPGTDPATPGPVQVRVQIFSAGTGALLFAGSFERSLGDFFVMQADIAREIAKRLHVVLAAREQSLVSRSRQVPPQAMEDYLAARRLIEIDMNLPPAIALLQRAIARSSGFAEAHVDLAACYAFESAYFGTVPSGVALKRALESSNTAIELDRGLPQAWAVRAFARFALEGNWKEAESDLKQALALDPANVDVLMWYSNYLTDRGLHGEAIKTGGTAVDRAPLSAVANRQLAWAYYMARQFEDATRQARRTLEIEPGYAPARTVLGRALIFQGQFDEGVKELEAAGREYEVLLAVGYARAGRRADAERLLESVQSPAYGRPVPAYDIGLIYAALGDQARAVEWLETAYARRDASITQMVVDPLVDSLRAHPRFRTLMERVNAVR
jgi:serine/threonine-protein kinase